MLCGLWEWSRLLYAVTLLLQLLLWLMILIDPSSRLLSTTSLATKAHTEFHSFCAYPVELTKLSRKCQVLLLKQRNKQKLSH